MRLVLDEDQTLFGESVRSFLAKSSPMSAVRADVETTDGHDRVLYQRLAAELGVQGLVVPERYGGAGAGVAKLSAAMQEAGAALLPGPLYANMVGTLAVLEFDDEVLAKQVLPEVASGAASVVVAMDDDDRPIRPDLAPVRARQVEGGYLLDGARQVVLNGADADTLLTAAALDGQTAVFAVAADTAGLVCTPLQVLDPTRRQSRVQFTATPARLVECANVGSAISSTLDLAAVLLAVEQLGIMRHCLQSIVEYSGVRVAFGRLIGSYQGVKHQLADLHCALELCESIVRYAVWTAADDRQRLPLAAAMAADYVGREAFRVASESLRLFGGVGYTWEHDAHLYFKRAKSNQLQWGPPRSARRRLAKLLIHTPDTPDAPGRATDEEN